MQILIKGGRVIDPGNFNGIADISIEDGKIVKIKSNDNSQQSQLERSVNPAVSGASS